ncbi:hypothetical protein VTO42DRAFT_7348 [Malbranchea cinnamomea]
MATAPDPLMLGHDNTPYVETRKAAGEEGSVNLESAAFRPPLNTTHAGYDADGNTRSAKLHADSSTLQHIIDYTFILGQNPWEPQVQSQHVTSAPPSFPDSTTSPCRSEELLNETTVPWTDTFVVQLAHIISCLEHQRRQSRTNNRPSMDTVLHHNRSCINRIIEAIEGGTSMRYPACRALAVEALGLVVSLYESCCSQCTADHRVPLQFGIFEIDPCDQIKLLKGLLSQEIDRCIRLIQRLRELSWLATARGLECGSVQNYVRLEQRANLLVSLLEE